MVADDDGSFYSTEALHQIEVELCNKLHSGIKGACNALFNIKVLLAFENKLDKLLNK